MPHHQEPGLYVTETNLLSPAHQKSPFPYKMVGGIVLPSGVQHFVGEMWRDGHPDDDFRLLESDYDEHLLESAAGFIKQYMSRGPNGSYNCHTFANWMEHGPHSPATTDPGVTEMDVTTLDRNLRPGERGYVFARGGDHSLIGLGGNFTIQAVTNYGNIGVLDHEEVAKMYGDTPSVVRK